MKEAFIYAFISSMRLLGYVLSFIFFSNTNNGPSSFKNCYIGLAYISHIILIEKKSVHAFGFAASHFLGLLIMSNGSRKF